MHVQTIWRALPGDTIAVHELRTSRNPLNNVTFPKSELPPVKGFWSLTLYNSKHLFSLNGPFSLYIRAYWGEKPIIDGTWQPPKIETVN